MTAAVWFAAALIFAGAAAIAFKRLRPRRAAAALMLVLAVGAAAFRQIFLALMLGGFALSLWRARRPDGAAPTPGQQSEIRTAGLSMTLDHDSGSMDGEVLAGPLSGARLSDLSAQQLQALAAFFAEDADSLALLLAYLDRRRGAGADPDAPPPAQTAMTEAEAYRVLGLDPGASVEEVREAYRRLIRRVHPDLGGSGTLAALINAAKERLDPD